MQRAAFILAALVLASPTLGADDKTSTEKPVIVDPLDLRKPVPNPDRELTEKYEGKTVQYSGQLSKWGQEKDKKTYWYELKNEIYKKKPDPKAKTGTKEVPEIVTVKVYFKDDENQLRAKNAQSQMLKVQGRGEIYADGSMVIRNARLLDMQPAAGK